MRIAASVIASSVAALASAAALAGCASEPPASVSTPKLSYTGTPPTVTLTEPAGGPTRDRN
ncbi:hypothetical protein [Prauserella cavernicola]|uniref:Uncharacterized protein n=1 Tax=Prauserella cavernicola TaxID=2800127 RepID=A0A934QR46_9PSEU|nr:hypothetical protein [Prauserella cavernicola]MBK1784697.1 hypothetical protein [Prauserella cavernicola]